ncbi:adenylosuccinate lyase family protein [Jatrophihabitans cynanchi]|uniref:Adenylosuccinate lyase family protein n=1 Tax=Jatrophihabitans cynanchi TaxID=2944128 RepID=A0ABY7K5Z0_9ACTN|nr:adenylosuccinate lyase family protein [Jatrophihabitans sp. SB3-54]WAX59032.1 adenylosuccinate lyase family protein [Jatrophihabitans sp. SB3-54]
MTFDLLSAVGGDDALAAIFTEQRAVQDWLEVEAALAHGLAKAGFIDDDRAERIAAACHVEVIDMDRLWAETAMVGYPIFPLIRMICDALGDQDAGFVHFGATTQDIMDTALALQLRDAGLRVMELLDSFGDALALLVERHEHTVMAGRTHAQQAVPTTFGAKCAGFLSELARHRRRLVAAVEEVATSSLYGAGGTSAALGARAPIVRAELSHRLRLGIADVPWHVSRDRPAHLVLTGALISATCVRFAREVIDLARTEVGEVAEADGVYRGASSTMPQKANPIASELAVGFGVMAQAAASSMFRASEAGHERSAGEWQAEWQAVPQACVAIAGSLRAAASVADGLRVFPDRMLTNLNLDGGRIMAEAYMIALATQLGREHAHEAVYQAVRDSRDGGIALVDSLAQTLSPEVWLAVQPTLPRPEQYLGQTSEICASALVQWREARSGPLYYSTARPSEGAHP